jgi:hypothetical protein
MTRPARVLATLAAAALLLAGCGSVSDKVGAAAFVGNTRIPDSAVQSWFDAVLQKEPRLKPQLEQQNEMGTLGRKIASLEVQQELLRQAALAEHLTVDEKSIDDAVAKMGGPQAATAGKIYTPANVRDEARSQLLAVELGRKYLDRLAITFDYTQASNRQEAQTKAQRMAQGQQQAAALVAADRQAGVPSSVGQQLRAADNAQIAAGTPIFGVPPGTVVAFQPDQQSGQWLVVRVEDRRTEAPSPTPVAGHTDPQILQEFGMQLLGMTEDRVGVQLSPRYGVWDPLAFGAAPNQDQTVGLRFDGRAVPPT